MTFAQRPLARTDVADALELFASNPFQTNVFEPEFQFSEALIQDSADQKYLVPVSVELLPHVQNTYNFLLRLEIEKLLPGEYTLLIATDETRTQSRAMFKTSFKVVSLSF